MSLLINSVNCRTEFLYEIELILILLCGEEFRLWSTQRTSLWGRASIYLFCFWAGFKLMDKIFPWGKADAGKVALVTI